MFRDIRKKKNEISVDAAKHLLEVARRGILAVNGDDGYPYAIPLNFLYCPKEWKIYFHGSRAGHKVDSIKRDEKVCFTVFGNESVKNETWAPYVQSAVVFGRCSLLGNQEYSVEILRKLARKYYPDEALIEEEISVSGKATQLFEIDIEHISGKEIQER